MDNYIGLSGKHILLYESGSGLDRTISCRLKELGASITSFRIENAEDVESCFKEMVNEDGAFDGFVFSITHSDFRPLQFVKPNLVNNPFSLSGKRVLVTGASSGIGMTTAIECSRMGAQVIVTGRNEERLQSTFNAMSDGKHQIVVADLTKEDDVTSLLDSIEPVDGVVLCAGQGVVIPLKMATRKRFDPIFEVNYFAPVELLRQMNKKRLLNDGCSLVFVASIGGIDSITVGNAVYGASKAAINSTMKFFALELAHKKIRANSVCPGMVNTRMIKDGALSSEQHRADMEKNDYPQSRDIPLILHFLGLVRPNPGFGSS